MTLEALDLNPILSKSPKKSNRKKSATGFDNIRTRDRTHIDDKAFLSPDNPVSQSLDRDFARHNSTAILHMDDTSDQWNPFQNVDRDSTHGQMIEHVLRTSDFDFLCSTAIRLRQELEEDPQGRSQTSADQLNCSINTDRFATGQQNVVLKLQFSDSECWVVRIRLPEEHVDSEAIEISMLNEVATMKLIHAKTNIPVPQVYGFDFAIDNQFGFRYLLMQGLPGHNLEKGLARCVPELYWDKVINQFADFYYQLSCLRFDSIGHLWMGKDLDQEPCIIPGNENRCFYTSLEYFYALQREKTKAVKAEHADDEQWGTAAWVLEQALPSMVVEDHVYGPFPLCHLDLHHDNILVDDDFNITGIIDWSNAQTVPLERFLISPEFATFPGLSSEKNAPTFRFRQKFATALRVRELAGLQSLEVDAISDGASTGLETTPSPPLISDLINTPLWEIVYRCTYSFYWRALSDSRLVMQQIYGDTAKLDDFITFYRNGPVHHIK